jgi:3-deoxy-D-manno-octulosonic-acid transferase
LLPIIDKLQSDIPNLLTCIAPRHPDRREEIISQLKHSNLQYSVRSRKESVETSTSVYLLDTLGELAGFYSYADVVFVGGSLIPHGGQNVLEPIAMGVPVVVGPHTFNFQSIVQSLVKQHGLVQVDDVESLYDITKQLFLDNNLHKTQSKLALDYLNQHRGALLSFKHIFQSVLSAYK